MIEVRAKGERRAEMTVYGPVGEGFFTEGVTAEKVRADIKAMGEVTDIDVYINSPGGNVWDGLAIANMLAAHPAQVHVHVEGLAASIASVIACAGDLITMGMGAQMMLHSPHALAGGNAEDLRAMADVLDKVENGMLDIYEARTGRDRDELRAILKAETWFSGSEAVEAKLADEFVSGKPREKVSASWQAVMACFRHTPEAFTPAPAGSMSASADAIPQEGTMNNQAPASVQPTDNAAAAAQARAEEKARVSAVTALCIKHGMTAAFTQEMIEGDVTAEAAAARILEAKADPGRITPTAELTEDAHDKMRAQASDWLVARAGLAKHDPANPFRGQTIEGVAREVLEFNGVRTRGMGREAVIKAAITHSTSDFPNIFENALHKSMLGGFEAAAPAWPRFCRTSSLSDFRPHLRYRPGSFSDILPVLENGEYQDGTIGDAERESITAVRKGRILNVSREMLVNDDMSVFSGVASYLGQAAARTLDKDVFGLFASNGPTMSDGNPLFHTDHGNLVASGGAAPTMDGFEAMRVLMASQLDPSGNDYLDLRPAIWLGPLSLGGKAREVNGAEYNDESQKNQRRPNISRGLVRDIVDTPRLPATIWYLLADPAVAPVFEVGFLDGIQVPQLEMEDSFRSDGISWRIRYEYGVAAIDWRGIVRNPGQ